MKSTENSTQHMTQNDTAEGGELQESVLAVAVSSIVCDLVLDPDFPNRYRRGIKNHATAEGYDGV